MWSWFGGQSTQKRRDVPKEAILNLREQLDMLQKREKHLEDQIREQETIAKKNVTTNKNGSYPTLPDIFFAEGRLMVLYWTAAKAALRRKKMHEKNLEQTQNQVMQLEQQVYSIETANINQETLRAMDNAGSAMKRMHDGLTMEKVDNMMFVPFSLSFLIGLYMSNGCYREKLREQQALADDIAQVITSTPFGEPVDEGELEDELANLEQETIDERMLKTGTVPVADQLNRLPVAGNGERMSLPFLLICSAVCVWTNGCGSCQRQSETSGGGRRRGSRTGETACRDGYELGSLPFVLFFGAVQVLRISTTIPSSRIFFSFP